ncbi:protein singed [Pantoea agglomerans]|uniref:protein singed n=1 Tax=Enterobacter agglomerans TaxID=549 RepID=UPI00117FC4E2|nr:protein singed [Pantoea agglomerans]NKE95229.1 protein singed [Pantoea agglomerans]TRO76767.1 protein singed [Pantoea agglomerans]
MTTYITVADVDEVLGSDWATPEKKGRALLQANAYLTALNLQGLSDVTPDDVKQAGAFLASASAAGVLYKQQVESGALTSKTVDADGVRVTKSYASSQSAGSSLLPEDVQLALALLKPWRSNPLAFRVYR